MAKFKSIVRFQGKLGDIQFYESDGNKFVRQDGSVSKERIMTDKAFKRTRENMSEFGGSAQASKSLRDNLSKVLPSFTDRATHNRLTAVTRQILSEGVGTRGKRPVTIMANKDLLVGFDFHRTVHFNSIFIGDYTLTSTAARNEATLTIPDFNTDSALNAPIGATHFRIILAVATLSDHAWIPSRKRYGPTSPALAKLDAYAASAILPLAGMVGSDITLTASLPGLPAMLPAVGLVACVGVEFYQEVSGTPYLFAEGNAMKIEEIF